MSHPPVVVSDLWDDPPEQVSDVWDDAPEAPPKREGLIARVRNAPGGGFGRLARLGKMVPDLAREALQGASSGFLDEAAGFASSAVPGLPNIPATTAFREQQEAFRAEHPATATAAQIAGGVLNPLNRVIGPGTGLASRIVRGAGSGLLGGATTAAGETDGTLVDRGRAAVAGGGVGALVGGTVPLVAAGTSRLFKPKTDVDRLGEMLDDVAKRTGVKRVNVSRAAEELDATRTNVSSPLYEAARPEVVAITPTMRRALSEPSFRLAERDARALAKAENIPFRPIFEASGRPVDKADIGSLQLLKRAINERMKTAQVSAGGAGGSPEAMLPSKQYQKAIRGRNREVVTGMREQSSRFASAEDAFAALSRELDELDLGWRFNSPAKFPTPRDVDAHISRLQGDERTRFVQGMIGRMEQEVTRRSAQQTPSPFLRLFKNPDLKARVRAAIPDEPGRIKFDKLMEREEAWARAGQAVRRSLIWQTGIGPVVRGTTALRDITGQAGGRQVTKALSDNEALIAFLLGQQAGGQ